MFLSQQTFYFFCKIRYLIVSYCNKQKILKKKTLFKRKLSAFYYKVSVLFWKVSSAFIDMQGSIVEVFLTVK